MAAQQLFGQPHDQVQRPGGFQRGRGRDHRDDDQDDIDGRLAGCHAEQEGQQRDAQPTQQAQRYPAKTNAEVDDDQQQQQLCPEWMDAYLLHQCTQHDRS
jgi:hypothetical protein